MVLASPEAQNKRKEKAAYRKPLEEYYQRISIAAPEEEESEEEGEDAPQSRRIISYGVSSAYRGAA